MRTIKTEYDIGDRIKISLDGSMDAVVSGICVTACDSVTYRCIWYHDGSRKDDWLRSFEMRGDGAKVEIQAGFNGDEKAHG